MIHRVKDESGEILVRLSLKKESLSFNVGRIICSATVISISLETNLGVDKGIFASGIIGSLGIAGAVASVSSVETGEESIFSAWRVTKAKVETKMAQQSSQQHLQLNKLT